MNRQPDTREELRLRREKLRRRREILFITLSALLLVTVMTSVIFFALWRMADGNTNSVSPTDTEPTQAELDALKTENLALQNQLEALLTQTKDTESVETAQTETDTPPVTEELPQETEEIITPTTVLPQVDFSLEGLYPDAPEQLTLAFSLEELTDTVNALRDLLENCPFLVSPDGELVPYDSIKIPEEDIKYRSPEGGACDADGIPLVRETDYEAMGYTKPTVALGYMDLTSGAELLYHGDTVLFSASLIKAPYVYTLLEQFALYRTVREANPTNDPKVGQTLSDEILEKFNLERKIKLFEENKEDGSGVIRDMDLSEGREFTVLELIQYAITVSDNTAFRVLRNEFGYDYFWGVSRRLGVTSVFSSFNHLTVADALKYLAAMYDFAEQYPYEGGILLGFMKGANHNVLIPYALKGKTTAHKYGWDAESYHDMALVFDEAPYALCIMTNFDFDKQSDTINDYIRALAQATDRVHEALRAVDDRDNG